MTEFPTPDGEQRTELIIEVLKKYSPLDCSIVGKSNLRAIAKKARFGSAPGGRQLDLMSSIGLLSGVATLIDLSLKAIIEYRKKHTDPLETKEFSIIREELTHSAVFLELVHRDPDVLSKVLKILAVMTVH